MPEHWTDRKPTENLMDYMNRLYDNCDWPAFDLKVQECIDANLPLPGPTVEALYFLRQMELAEHDPR